MATVLHHYIPDRFNLGLLQPWSKGCNNIVTIKPPKDTLYYFILLKITLKLEPAGLYISWHIKSAGSYLSLQHMSLGDENKTLTLVGGEVWRDNLRRKISVHHRMRKKLQLKTYLKDQALFPTINVYVCLLLAWEQKEQQLQITNIPGSWYTEPSSSCTCSHTVVVLCCFLMILRWMALPLWSVPDTVMLSTCSKR